MTPKLTLLFSIVFIVSCAAQEPYDPVTAPDYGYKRFLTSWNLGQSKNLYTIACSTRHTDPTIISQCYADQYKAGLLIIQSMVDDSIPPEVVYDCMNTYHFPEGTPDLQDIVVKSCLYPK